MTVELYAVVHTSQLVPLFRLGKFEKSANPFIHSVNPLIKLVQSRYRYLGLSTPVVRNIAECSARLAHHRRYTSGQPEPEIGTILRSAGTIWDRHRCVSLGPVACV